MGENLALFRNSTVLITGGGGYLGSKLAERLASSRATVYLLDIRFNAISERLFLESKNILKVKLDITHKEALEKKCCDISPDYIYHFCSLLNRDRDFENYPLLYEVNVKGTLNLLESLKEIPYKGFFFSSSSEVYGSKNRSPFNENMLPEAASPYSLTKLMAENLIKTYSEIHQKPYCIFRIFNFFGIDMPESFFINQLIASLKRKEFFPMTGGEQTRDFLHIDALIRAIFEISFCQGLQNETVNICSGKGIALKDLAIGVAEIMGSKELLQIGALPYRKNEVWGMIGDNNKLKKACVFSNQELIINYFK